MEVERAGARRSYLARRRTGIYKKKFGKKPYQPAISRAIYGRETVVKLTRTFDVFTTLTYAKNVYGIVAQLQGSNDWGNYSNSFQQYNILKVKVRILLGNTSPGTTALPSCHVLGMCYSTKSDTALTDLNQVADHDQYILMGTSNADSSKIHQFKFYAKPNNKPPFSTNTSTENFGWIKLYSDAYGGNTVFVCKLSITFTVCFSGEA